MSVDALQKIVSQGVPQAVVAEALDDVMVVFQKHRLTFHQSIWLMEFLLEEARLEIAHVTRRN